MFEDIDLARPLEDPLVGALQLAEYPAVVLRLLEVGEGHAGDQVDLIHQRLQLFDLTLVCFYVFY